MLPADDDLDSIQNQMDVEYDRQRRKQLREWHMRLRSSWGCRHWRCEQRTWRPAHGIDKIGFMSLMTVCKRLYPEVAQSIFENHKFMFNDIASAHEFLVGNTVPFTRHIRDMELTFNMGQYHYEPFLPEPDVLAGQQHDVGCRPFGNWVNDIWEALGAMTCLHNVRISFDVHDRGVWRKIPERNVTKALKHLRVKHDFTVELPSKLQIIAPRLQGQTLEEDEETNFQIIRRPRLRYWKFDSDRIERFSWELGVDPVSGRESCYIAVLKNTTYVPTVQAPYNNPHLD
ncbi:hypothetical protein Micbo1qcDRAFT_213389 [Microdochium bolleyi]|uniref:DUF7730 domain-containing protein n=1 Tax=Microdochium bolleyi TaxID=196109 RepID=A0A136IVQ1_9PEZI|nr:hypothetical protein Micbo1qcDRAFT_213389 [Microdochium bolleyi]